MAGTASGTTVFVLGREADGNRETRIFTDGQAYDLDWEYLASPYSSEDTRFPYELSAEA